MQSLDFDILEPVTIDGVTLTAGPHRGFCKIDASRPPKKTYWVEPDYRPKGLHFNEEPGEYNVTEHLRAGCIVIK